MQQEEGNLKPLTLSEHILGSVAMRMISTAVRKRATCRCVFPYFGQDCNSLADMMRLWILGLCNPEK